MGSPSQNSHVGVWDHVNRWRLLAPMVGLFTAVALLAGCAQTQAAPMAKVVATSTVVSTPTPLPPAPLTWTKTTLPSSVTGAAVAIAPSDAATVYACVAPHPTGGQVEQPQIWVTHDYAAHWSQMTSIPADQANNACAITVDQINPLIAVAVLSLYQPGANHPNIQDSNNYVTYDGGATWRKLTDSQPFEMSLLTGTATRNGTTYAIRDVLSGGAFHTGLWVSYDHMTTWRLIDAPTGGIDAMTFWLQPTTGALLALYGNIQGPSSLWESVDGGMQWTQVNAPARTMSGALELPYLAEPHAAQPGWTICVTDVGVAGEATASSLTCSVDDGKSWDTRPAIVPEHSSSSGAQLFAFAFGMESDGTVLATLSTDSASAIYRLSPGAEQWQSLGDLPGGMSYATLAGGNVIWKAPTPPYPIIATAH